MAVTVALATALAWDPAAAAVQTDEACRDGLAAVGADTTAADPCQALSVRLGAVSPTVGRAFRAIAAPRDLDPSALFSQRDLQARHPQHADLSGSLAQTRALPTVRPAGVATGSIAVLGSDAGDDAVAAVGLNPAIFLLGDAVSEALAKYSRFADLSLLVPVSGLNEDGDDDIDYVGVRLRLNWHGLDAGSRLWEDADALLERWISRVTDRVVRTRELLAGADDLAACARALAEEQSRAAVETACGGTVAFGFTERDVERLRAAFAEIRRAADAAYLGADIRMDFGDPTLGEVAGASGTFLFAGVAAGRRFDVREGAVSYGFGGRIGARHASLDGRDDGELAFEGTVGFELARRFQEQEIGASVALDLRYGGAGEGLEEAYQTDFALFRGSLLVPIGGGNDLSVAVGLPVDGAVSSFLSVSFNWGLLLPDEAPEPPF